MKATPFFVQHSEQTRTAANDSENIPYNSWYKKQLWKEHEHWRLWCIILTFYF